LDWFDTSDSPDIINELPRDSMSRIEVKKQINWKWQALVKYE